MRLLTPTLLNVPFCVLIERQLDVEFITIGTPCFQVDIQLLSGEMVMGHTLVFQAYHYEGSEVTYHWDFGDGETLTKTITDKVMHTYDRYVQ